MARVVNREALRTIRELVGVTQAELARRAGVSCTLLSLIESGDRPATPRVQRLLADHLGVPLDAITSVVPEAAKAAS